jgi:hypothetical protein
MYVAPPSWPCFAAADRYAAFLARYMPAVCEGGLPVGNRFPWSERHLRCVWADPAYRPEPLTTYDGQFVTVENAGRWNVEAGPDFLDAVLRLTPGERRLVGDVELHVRPGDWRQHGHTDDPLYRRVIAHVTYFGGTVPDGELPAGAIQLALQEALRRKPSFSFDSLDVMAYPFACFASPTPCSDILRSWPPEDRGALLDAAGTERLRRKTERMAEAIREKGTLQTLYEEVFCALGYKNNRIPCRELASRVPLEALQSAAAKEGLLAAYALLCGVAGLLPARTQPLWDADTRRFVRELWDVWWKLQSTWQNRVMLRRDWTLRNLRPQNHPLRRLVAGVDLFCGPQPLQRQLESIAESPALCKAVLEALETAGMASHWARRHSLSGPRLAKPLALIGPGRAAAILTNVVIPWTVATSNDGHPDDRLLRELPVEDDNRLIRHTAHALFGRDHTPALYHSGLRQQGLLQIFHDFCLNARNGCRSCAFPQALIHQKQ